MYANLYAIIGGMAWCFKNQQEILFVYNLLLLNELYGICGTEWDCVIMADGCLRLRQ